jgi:hypothetical protein
MKQKISFDEAKNWILQNYTLDKILEMFDEEVFNNWVDKENMENEGYDNEYDYYIDYMNGEAEGAVRDEIIQDLENLYELDFDTIGDNTDIYQFINETFDILNK